MTDDADTLLENFARGIKTHRNLRSLSRRSKTSGVEDKDVADAAKKGLLEEDEEDRPPFKPALSSYK